MGDWVRTEWIQPKDVGLLLALLTPENRLVCQVSLACGLRVGDVVALRRVEVENPNSWITEKKTGRRRRLCLGKALRAALLAQAGDPWVFEGARDKTRHRTRQAVWRDLQRAAKALRLKVNVGPHSMRKCFAVDLMERSGSLEEVRRSLGHEDTATTLLYALADQLGDSKQCESRQGRRVASSRRVRRGL